MESLVQKAFERKFNDYGEPIEQRNETRETAQPQTEQKQPTQQEPVQEQPASIFQPPAEITPAQESSTPVQGSPTPTAEDTLSDVQKEFGLDVREAKICVMGCGGAGNNCVKRLTDMGVKGAHTIAVNTDAKHLSITNSHSKLLIGRELTKGLGAGGYPDIGRRAVQESERDIRNALKDVDMLYITTGLGGGTGTGSAPMIAEIAKEMGAIVIGCVTMPFKIEGARIGKAEEGLYQLRQVCDTVVVIENDRLLKIAGDLPVAQAFGVADNLIATTIKGVTETISQPSLVNLDYADVKTVMHSGGVASVGFGESGTKNRAEEAVVKAMTNPLLEVSYEGGTGALIHITGGSDLRLDEVNLIGEYVSKQLDPDAQVIWGARIDPEFQNKIRVITLMTGIKSPYILGPVAEKIQKNNDFSQELGIPVIGR